MYIDIARGREKYIPVMSDFYDILMEQPEDEAKDIVEVTHYRNILFPAPCDVDIHLSPTAVTD